MAAEGGRKGLEEEYDQIAADIEQIEQMFKGPDCDGSNLSSEQLLALRSELGDLLKRRESILAARTEQLLAMDKERLDAERYFLVKFRTNAIKEEWKSISRMAQIETNMANHSNHLQREKAAAVVNQFIDAVVEMNIDKVKKLSATALRKELGLARVRSMRRNTPAELDTGGFDLRQAGKNRLEVWTGQKKILTLCSEYDGNWLIEQAWE